MASFTGQVVLVTGASRGIGAAIAKAFAAAGAVVVGIARTDPGLPGIHWQACDLRNSAVGDLRQLVDTIAAAHGRLDVLVNNAGIIRRAPTLEFSETDWDDVIQINLKAAFFLTQAVARWWVEHQKPQEQGRLKIINLASLLSFQGGILVPSYTASKHGIAGLTKLLGNEWAPLGINVNAIAPGYIATENTRALREDPQRRQAILDRIPAGRWGEPDDIAGTCLFLASPAADYLNGAIVNVDGGWLGR